jgi:hypothetical protein
MSVCSSIFVLFHVLASQLRALIPVRNIGPTPAFTEPGPEQAESQLESTIEKKKQPENDQNGRLQTERELVDAIVSGASKSTKRIVDFVPEYEKKPDLTIKIFLEYLCFFLHMTNRLAWNVASYKEVDEMYNTIAPVVVGYVLHEVLGRANEDARRAVAEAIPELIEARESNTRRARNTLLKSGNH